MKNKLFKIGLSNILLACLLLSLSCGDASQNKTTVNTAANNTANNAANNTVVQTNSNSNKTGTLDADCEGDATAKKKKIKDGIEKVINGEDNLKYQYKTKFDIDPVVDANGNAVLYIWGELFTSAKNLNQLNNSYESFVKKGCVTKVVFDKAPDQKALRAGFEFNLCEAPNQVCSDGSCQQTCSMPSSTETKTNSNAKP